MFGEVQFIPELPEQSIEGLHEVGVQVGETDVYRKRHKLPKVIKLQVAPTSITSTVQACPVIQFWYLDPATTVVGPSMIVDELSFTVTTQSPYPAHHKPLLFYALYLWYC